MYKLLLSLILLLGLLMPPSIQAQTVVVYSARMNHLIKPLFDAYKQATGVSVKFITAKETALIGRLVDEGEATPADLLITVDVAHLWLAAQRGLLQTVDSEILQNNIPAYLRDPNKQWFGLSARLRAIMYSSERLKPADLQDYPSLADSQWAGKLCVRTSRKTYNRSLIAMFIARHGRQETEHFLQGWINNLAIPPLSSDSQVLQAIASGQCDVGIANTYYLARILEQQPNFPVSVFFHPGVHINASGAGIVKHAKHPEAALRLLEWLSSPVAQQQFAQLNFEYPVNPAVKPAAIVEAWGTFTPEQINLSEAGNLRASARQLIKKIGYR